MAPRSEAQKRATKKWNDANLTVLYDGVYIRVAKGKKSEWQKYAAARGESLAAFLARAADEQRRRDGLDSVPGADGLDNSPGPV